MHYALPGSALAHALALGAGLMLFAWPEPSDAPAAQSVSVELIAMASVSANQTGTIQSDAADTLVSSGAEALPSTKPQTIVAREPETLDPAVRPEAAEPPLFATLQQTTAPRFTSTEPVETTPTEPQRLEMAVLSAVSPEPLQAEVVAPAAPGPTTPLQRARPVQPLQQATLLPVEITDLEPAPVPHSLSRPRPSEPTRRLSLQQTESLPLRTTPKSPVAPPRLAAPAGNGGQNQADSVAARPATGQEGNAGLGGDAEVARYPSQVVAKLRRALRYPGGAGGAAGEVHVQFTVSAGGQPSGMRIVKSSGNAVIDQAGVETVLRAAPFPPIPAGANRASWGFIVQLAFVRG
ncbi:TonB family protein [uncultured Devosia sp.]|uniref:energy transducer TonB family protein n=1 Tax=uncultured Devosia sp. TaxID=211434 RepID=UPI0035CB598B